MSNTSKHVKTNRKMLIPFLTSCVVANSESASLPCLEDALTSTEKVVNPLDSRCRSMRNCSSFSNNLTFNVSTYSNQKSKTLKKQFDNIDKPRWNIKILSPNNCWLINNITIKIPQKSYVQIKIISISFSMKADSNKISRHKPGNPTA